MVFPSNIQLSIRAHGIAEATLRRHLALLVEAGLIIRKDSANGKRYARKDEDGSIEHAFGFDISPLLMRAEELACLAQKVAAEGLLFRRGPRMRITGPQSRNRKRRQVRTGARSLQKKRFLLRRTLLRLSGEWLQPVFAS